MLARITALALIVALSGCALLDIFEEEPEPVIVCFGLEASETPEWLLTEPGDLRFHYAIGSYAISGASREVAMPGARSRALVHLNRRITANLQTLLAATDVAAVPGAESLEQHIASAKLRAEDISLVSSWVDVDDCRQWVLVRILRSSADNLRWLENAEHNYAEALDDNRTVAENLLSVKAALAALDQIASSTIHTSRQTKNYYQDKYLQRQRQLATRQAQGQLGQLDQLLQELQESGDLRAQAVKLNSAQRLFAWIDFSQLANHNRADYAEQLSQAQQRLQQRINANKQLIFIQAESGLNPDEIDYLVSKLKAIGYQGTLQDIAALDIDAAQQQARNLAADSLAYVVIRIDTELTGQGNWRATIDVTVRDWQVQAGYEIDARNYRASSTRSNQSELDWRAIIDAAFSAYRP